MNQMIIDERKRIEFLTGCGWTVPKIAGELGRSPSTVRNELIKHRIDSDKRLGCSNRLCANFDECARKVFTGFGERLGRNTPKCFRTCPDFREAACPRLARPPFVCNGCRKERECPSGRSSTSRPSRRPSTRREIRESRWKVPFVEPLVV